MAVMYADAYGADYVPVTLENRNAYVFHSGGSTLRQEQ